MRKMYFVIFFICVTALSFSQEIKKGKIQFFKSYLNSKDSENRNNLPSTSVSSGEKFADFLLVDDNIYLSENDIKQVFECDVKNVSATSAEIFPENKPRIIKSDEKLKNIVSYNNLFYINIDAVSEFTQLKVFEKEISIPVFFIAFEDFKNNPSCGKMLDIYRETKSPQIQKKGVIGIRIIDKNGRYYIGSVLADSPAERAGLKSNDEIIGVDGKQTKELALDKIYEFIDGEPGTILNIKVISENKEISMDITRVKPDVVLYDNKTTDTLTREEKIKQHQERIIEILKARRKNRSNESIQKLEFPDKYLAKDTNKSVLAEYWFNIEGLQVSDLTNNPNFPYNPSKFLFLKSFEIPNGFAEDYGCRIRGYIIPKITGRYIFRITSDDFSELFLSMTSNPHEKKRICFVPGWTRYNQWDLYPEQKSEEIKLISGNKYYIEALFKEGWGGDHLIISWRLPNGEIESPIPNDVLMPFIENANLGNVISDNILSNKEKGNLLIKDDFDGDLSEIWKTDCWNRSIKDKLTFGESNNGINGSTCIYIENKELNDSYWYREIKVEPNELYLAECWIKEENVILKEGNIGANISILDTWEKSNIMTQVGDSEWKKVRLYFLAPETGIVQFACRLGYFASTVTGKAYFDNFRVFKPKPLIEGKHIDLFIDEELTRNISKDNLKKWVKNLDKYYKALVDLTGVKPFKGNKIAILSDNSHDYWATAGNPIRWNKKYISSELEKVNKGDDWSFGILHEISHDFDTEGFNWNGEMFSNIKMCYALERTDGWVKNHNGKKYHGIEMSKFYYDGVDNAYVNSIQKGKYHIDGHTYIFLRLKNEIGWEPFKRTFRYFNESKTNPRHPKDKYNLFMEKLSDYSGIDVRSKYSKDELDIIENKNPDFN